MSTLRLLWKWSPVVTMPVAVIFVVWMFGVGPRWFDFEVRMHTSTDLDLATVGRLEAEHMLRKWDTGVTGTKRDELLKESGLRNIHLYIQKRKLKQLDSNLPHSAREYVEGGMYYDGAIREVDLRYRGDNVYHWGYWKKSWRVKTKRDDLFEGMRKFNLVAPRTPEIVNNYLALKVASSMGLLSPIVELVHVTVNGQVSGLFILTEQIEESLIRRHGRMPGDVYSGELVGVDSYKGVNNNLFYSAGLWKKAAVNNHFDEQSLAPLEALLSAIEGANTPQGQERLMDLVDVDAFATYSVYESVVGTVHSDEVHNWRLYYDPWKTQFVPIPWDPVGWHRTVRKRRGVPLRPDVVSSQLHSALHRNGVFLTAKSRAFREFFESHKDEALLTELDSAIASIRPILQLDPNLVEEGTLLQPQDVWEGLRTLRSYLIEHLDSLRQVHLTPQPELVYEVLDPGTLSLRINRGRLLEDLRIRYFNPIKDPVVAVVTWFEESGQKSLDISNTIRTTSHGELHFDVSLLSDARRIKKNGQVMLGHAGGIEVLPGEFGLSISGLPAGSEILELCGLIDGKPVIANLQDAPLQFRPMADMTSRVMASSVGLVQVWQGERRIEGLQIIDDPVVILEGTRFLLDPGASLIFRGTVQARGTTTHPIEFLPSGELGPDHAWGTVATKGEGSNGSTFRSCRFLGGSGIKQDLYEYSAMFSVHGTKNVIVEDCSFEDSFIVDDMVHGVYTDIIFRRCTWTRSLADALDLDISRAVVEDCRFVDSGNDAIDLMTTQASVIGCVILNSGDKGISIGEASRLIAIENTIDGCAIGLQSKDDSYALAINSELLRCNQGVDAYKKNWRYNGGGTIYLMNSVIEACLSPMSADSDSIVGIDDCFVDGFDFQKVRKRVRTSGSDDTDRKAKSSGAINLFGDERPLKLYSKAKAHWGSRIDLARRGLLPHGR